ncbi:MAG: iron ABC transporter permease [Bacteroidetes bacterium]|nr:iron ABC transporter permease [Bacteroidota bacterium]
MNNPSLSTPARTLRISVLFALLTVACGFLALWVGPFSISFSEIFRILIGDTSLTADSMRAVLLEIRLPRVLIALLVGGGLAVSGAVFQVLLRNVLADPYILGVSSGASVGALVALSTGLSTLFLASQPLFAFASALIVVVTVYRLGLHGAIEDNTLLLSGVMIGAFLSAIILGLVSTMDRPVRNALFWLIGYLGNATMTEVLLLFPGVVILLFVLFVYAGRMNVMALGAEAAGHLGLAVRRQQIVLYVLASLMTALVVSFAGAIGFIGLLVPHAVRRLFGPDHRLLLPVSFFLGASFLIISDLIARTAIAPTELPVGAVTAALGAPVFIYLLRRKSALRT